MSPHIMILEAPFSKMLGAKLIGLDKDDVTGIAWLMLHTREFVDSGFARDPITSPTEIVDQLYYSDIVI